LRSAKHKRTTAVLRRLPLGTVKPLGWLADQLRLQAQGLTGTLEAIWPDVGPTSAWLGGKGEDWERGPYYLDGLVPLAHLLDDDSLKAKASKWINAILSSQREDGFFGPSSNDDWWPRMVALKALIQHAEATSDERVAPFLQRYFRHQLKTLAGRPLRNWGKWRGAENSIAVAWLYDRTGEDWLLELADLLEAQTTDWDRYFTVFPHRDVTTVPRLSTHVVNIAMGVKGPALRQAFHPDPGHRAALDAGLANLDRYHGQVHGMFSGDEHLAGPDAARGTELCAVVEILYSLQEVVRVFGDPAHADRLERIAYNLLPAAMDARCTTHQYHQQANQVLVSIAPRDWTAADDDCQIFGLAPNFGCCTANLHQGWPKLLQSMWMTGGDGALHAVVHGPSSVRVADEHGLIALAAETNYPFTTTIRYTVTESNGAERTLRFRVPQWAEAPTLSGPDGAVTTVTDGYLSIGGRWKVGDVFELELPRRPRINERPSGGVGIDLGALVMVYSPGEVWERVAGSVDPGYWEIRARWGWNLALAVDDELVGAAVPEFSAPSQVPFGLSTGYPERKVDGVPVRLQLPGRRLDEWELYKNSAASPPALSNVGAYVHHRHTLVPYGSTRIRVAEFPRLAPEKSERWDEEW
jgi:Beta-L-arabinofuranosidase, GH127